MTNPSPSPFRCPCPFPAWILALVLGPWSGPIAAAELVAGYHFNAGDTMAMTKNGFSWAAGATTIDAPPGQSETGVRFTFEGDPDPQVPNWVERRFQFAPQHTLYIRERFFIPANYFHRGYTGLTMTGDISTWQVGDALLAADGESTGTIAFKDGQDVFMLFPERRLSGPGVWTGAITNVARSATLPAVRYGISDNNKVFALWCDGYSFHGQGPSMVFEMRPDEAGGSRIYYHFGADGGVTGTLPNSTSEQVPFIRPQDFGTWMDLVIRVTHASSETAEDGIVELYLKRQGDTAYTRVLAQDNCQIGRRAASTPPQAAWQNGYLWGWWNTGVTETLTIHVSVIELYQDRPAFLDAEPEEPPPGNTPPVAHAQNVSSSSDTARVIVLTGTDADGDSLTYSIVTGPAHGTLSGTGANRTYLPQAGHVGSDSFTFRVHDGTVASAAATIAITVTAAVSDPPPPPAEENTGGNDGQCGFGIALVALLGFGLLSSGRSRSG